MYVIYNENLTEKEIIKFNELRELLINNVNLNLSFYIR